MKLMKKRISYKLHFTVDGESQVSKIRDDFRRRLIEDGFHLRTTEDLSRAGIYGCPQTTEDLNREDIPSALENSVGNYLVTFGAKPCTSCVIHLNWNHEGELTAKLNDFANNYVPPLK